MKALDAIFLCIDHSGNYRIPVLDHFRLAKVVSKLSQPTPSWREKIADVSTVLFLAGVLIGLAAGWTSKDIGHREVFRKLASMDPDCRISINGRAAENTKEVLGVLKTIDWLPAHHSNPTKRINIDISDRSPRLTLSLSRDSSDPQEYWVFWPKYHVTAHNEVGRIKTSLFDAY